MIIQKDELETFKALIKSFTNEAQPFSLGTVASNHTSGRPQIVFDGDSSPSTKRYPYLSSYTPTANDRVLLVNIGGSHIVIGKIV